VCETIHLPPWNAPPKIQGHAWIETFLTALAVLLLLHKEMLKTELSWL
jgi:hypothetical protein